MNLELSDEELEICADGIDAWYSEYSVGDDWSQKLALRDKIRDYLEDRRPEYGPPLPRRQSYYEKAPEVSTIRDRKWRWVPGESVPRGQTGSTLGT